MWYTGSSIQYPVSTSGPTHLSAEVGAVTTNTESVGVLSKISRYNRLHESAYLRIKSAILSGELPSGEPLVATQLAKQLGVSRTPIRKALSRLEQEGYVISDPVEGYRIAKITVQDIEEIYEFRKILEPYVVRQTTGEFTDEELEEIGSALRAGEEALQEGDILGVIQANRAFHHAFDRKHGNERISDVLENLDEQVRWILLTVLRAKAEGLATCIQEHELILAAVREGDVQSATSLMEKHLTDFMRAALAHSDIAEHAAQ